MAAVMEFVTRMETETAAFYERAADRFPALGEQFQAFAKENKRFEKQVKQTYFGVITDTLESNYCFEGLDDQDFAVDASLPVELDEATVRAKAVDVESALKGFYETAASMSEGLMADVPRLFKRIAKKRDSRIQALT
jgi:hypothetical protein